MSIKYRNFTRPGSGYQVTHVPDRLVNKHRSLYIIEFLHFIFGGFLVLAALWAMFAEEGANIILYSVQVVIGVLFVTGGFLLSMDKPACRKCIIISYMGLMIYVPLVVKKLVILGVVLLVAAIVLLFIYVYPPNKEYFRWAQSISE